MYICPRFLALTSLTPSQPYCQRPQTQASPNSYLPTPRSQENQLRAHQWMQKLHDQLGLQHLLRDCHEVGTPAVLGHRDFLPRQGSAPAPRRSGGGGAPSKWVAERSSLRAARRRADPGLRAHAPQGSSTHALGKEGGALSAPGNGARPRPQVPRGRALISPFPAGGS